MALVLPLPGFQNLKFISMSPITIKDYNSWVFLKNPNDEKYPYGQGFEKGGCMAHLQQIAGITFIVIEKVYQGQAQVMATLREDLLEIRGESPEDSLIAVMNVISYPISNLLKNAS